MEGVVDTALPCLSLPSPTPQFVVFGKHKGHPIYALDISSHAEDLQASHNIHIVQWLFYSTNLQLHMHTHPKIANANSLVTASGYAHLAERGGLCTKQALSAM